MDDFQEERDYGEQEKWYSEFPKAEEPHNHSKSDMEVIELKSEAKRLLDGETKAFELKESKSRDSEKMWLKTALSQGTSTDKVAASVILIQNKPKYNLTRLASLVSQVKAAKQNQGIQVACTLKDLFLSDLLHPEHTLLKFDEQNLDKLDSLTKSQDASKNKLLTYWYFEDQLKEQYEKFICSVASVASDTVEANREKAVPILTELLQNNAEQEQKLLELIINKIGDPSSKVASKTVFCLTKLIHEHPNMKMVLLKEVEKFLFRRNMSPRAQYYATCLLTQFLLSKDDKEVATSLIDLYFAFFKACLKKGEPDSRMMSAILMGVNRAYPFADLDKHQLKEHINSVYKVVHIGSFAISLNALSLLHQVSGKDTSHAERFYSAFYRKLLDPQIGTTNKRAMFLNLLYRVLQKDTSIARLTAFIKRLLQIAMHFPAEMACATLYVLSRVLQGKKKMRHLLIRSRGDSIKKEKDEGDNDETTAQTEKSTIQISNVSCETNNDPANDESIMIKEEILDKPYDPFARNPHAANGLVSFHDEIVALANHFHPSVSLFATTIASGKPIEYTGDPLEDLTLIRFLDRYVFKNPKKLESKKVVKKNDPFAARASYTPRGIRSLPVGSEAYLNEREDRIPVDELFLYKYLKKKQESRPVKTEDESDNESVNSEDFNAMLDELGNDDEDLDEMDIAADVESSSKKKKGKRKTDSEDEGGDSEESGGENEPVDEQDDSENEELDGESMEGDDFESLSDMDVDGISDEDLSDMDFDESDDEKPQKKQKEIKGLGKVKKGKPDANVFVAAEEFAEMLERQGRSKFKVGSSNAFSDMDGANAKQIAWEMKRNDKIKRGGRMNKNNNFSSNRGGNVQKRNFNNKKKSK